MRTTPRGRPRDPGIDDRILLATRELLVEAGYGATTIEAVAARAGVGKPTVYRRYPTKAALVFEAVFGRTKKIEIPDTGSLRDDLVEAYSWAVYEFSAPEAQASLPGLMADISGSPEQAAHVRATIVEPEYARVRGMLERGQKRGEIRDDVDLELVIDVFTGAVLTRATLVDHAVDQEFGIRLVDLVLDGLRPRD